MIVVPQPQSFAATKSRGLKRWVPLSLVMLAPLAGGATDLRAQGSEIQVLPKFVVPAGSSEEFCVSEAAYLGPGQFYFKALKRRPEREGLSFCRFTFPASSAVNDQDQIVSINGRAVKLLRGLQCIGLLCAPAETPITLELRREGEKKLRRLELVVRSYTPGSAGQPGRVAYVVAPSVK